MKNEEKFKTAEERKIAHTAYCDRKGYDCDTDVSCIECAFNWLALEAVEESPEPCFYCGGKVHLDDNGPMLFYIKCNCGYRSRDFTRRDIAIAAHNRMARAVRAERESEEK